MLNLDTLLSTISILWYTKLTSNKVTILYIILCNKKNVHHTYDILPLAKQFNKLISHMGVCHYIR